MVTDINYAALAVSILSDCFPEIAFEKLYNPHCISVGKKSRNMLTDTDIENMMRYKCQGLTYKQVGSIYGISDHCVNKRIQRYKKRISI